jgi:hypothetical protein
MAIAFSTTRPGTRFWLWVKRIQAASGVACFELGWEAHDSGKRSGRRYPDAGQIRALLEECDIDGDTIRELMRSVVEQGFGEIPEWWLLDEQAKKLGIYVCRS